MEGLVNGLDDGCWIGGQVGKWVGVRIGDIEDGKFVKSTEGDTDRMNVGNDDGLLDDEERVGA